MCFSRHTPHLSTDILHIVFLALLKEQTRLDIEPEPLIARPLLGVNRLWRAAILPIYCRSVTLVNKVERTRFYRTRNSLSIDKLLALGWSEYVRQVNVVYTQHFVSFGSWTESISSLHGQFANVKHARLFIWSHAKKHDIENIFYLLGFAFSGLVSAEIEIKGVIDQQSLYVEYPIAIAKSAHRVCQMIGKASISSYGNLGQSFAFFLLTAASSRLVHLVVELSSNSEVFGIYVAQKHADTLKTLRVKYIQIRNCVMLIQKENGSNIQYPLLNSLSLDVLGAHDSQEIQFRGAAGGCPFPRLEYFSCNGIYPFSNDVLLCGAYVTLKSLVLAIDFTVISWMAPGILSNGKECEYLTKFKALHMIILAIIIKSHQGTELAQQMDKILYSLPLSMHRVYQV